MAHSPDELSAFAEWERAAWEARAASYAASLGALTRGSIPALLDAAGVRSGTRVLDAGTGPGFVALAAIERDAVVHAVDQSSAMVQIARAAGVPAQLAGAESLPFDDAVFDAVVAGYLLNHLPRPEAGVAEFARVVVPGGRLAMTVWDVAAENPSTGSLAPVIAELGLTDAGLSDAGFNDPVPPGPDSQRFSADDELLRLLAGWDDIRITRPRWTLRTEPGAWFDALANSTPRAGAVLAQAADGRRAQARRRYIELTTERYGEDDGTIRLPAGAVLVSARRR